MFDLIAKEIKCLVRYFNESFPFKDDKDKCMRPKILVLEKYLFHIKYWIEYGGSGICPAQA